MKSGIFGRLLLSLITLLLVSGMIMGVMLLRDANDSINKAHLQQAQTMVEGLAQGSLDALAAKDYELLERWLQSASSVTDFAYAYFSRADGVVLSHTALQKVATQADALGELDQPQVRHLLYRGRPVIEVAHPAYLGKQHMANAHLAYYTDVESLDSQRIYSRLFVLMLVSLLFLSVATFFILRRFLHPLETLSNAVEQAREFELDLPPELLRRQDEIGLLARRFQALMQRLQASFEAVSREKEFNQVTLESIGDAVIVTDADGRVQAMNPVSERLTGWNTGEAIGHSVKDVFPIIDASTRQPIENPVEKVLKTGEVVYLSNHTTLIARDGGEYQIADSAAPIRNAQGEILGMVLVFNDVTEAYQLREQARQIARQTENERALLRSLIDSVNDLIYIKDTDSRYVACNKAFEEFAGCSEQELIGKRDDEVFSADFAAMSLEGDRKVLTTGEALREIKQVSYPDGREVIFDIVKSLFHNPNGELLGLFGICRDITELRKKEEQLRQSMKMEALGNLTGGVAHDYNNMLGIIIGYTEMLKKAVAGDDRLEKYIHAISRASERGAALTRKLLAFSRQSASTETPVNLNRLISDEQDFLVKTLTASIDLQLELAPDLWDSWLDAGDLEDAIINLCINAKHAMHDKGELRIRTRNVVLEADQAAQAGVAPGEYVELEICDNGVGMTADVREHIFDPFFSTKGEEGTGLGLSQVYGFVQRSNGAVLVHSEPGRGSCFTLLFPRYQGAVTDETEPASTSPARTDGSARIMVVDDEPDLRDLYRELLEAEGYEVVVAENASQVLASLQQQSVDILISDIIMPDRDGVELAAEVRRLYPHIKIQLISGYNAKLSDLPDRDIGILQKPLRAEDLLERIRELLG